MKAETCLKIVPVKGRRMLKQFIHFPLDLYKGCDKWVPALEDDEYKSLGDENPSLAFCERELYLALREGKVVGRIAAIINHNADKKWGEKVVRFGWMDFIEDFQVAKALVDRVADWGKERGAQKIKGPWASPTWTGKACWWKVSRRKAPSPSFTTILITANTWNGWALPRMPTGPSAT